MISFKKFSLIMALSTSGVSISHAQDFGQWTQVVYENSVPSEEYEYTDECPSGSENWNYDEEYCTYVGTTKSFSVSVRKNALGHATVFVVHEGGLPFNYSFLWESKVPVTCDRSSCWDKDGRVQLKWQKINKSDSESYTSFLFTYWGNNSYGEFGVSGADSDKD